MGQSTYGCRPRARSRALQPRQFPISNVCRTRMIYNDSTAVMSFPATIYVDNRGSGLPDSLDTGEALERYGQVSQKIEALIAKDAKDGDIQSVITEVPGILLKCVNRDEAALAVAQKVFNSLYDNTSNSGGIMWYVATLIAIRDVWKLVVKELTNWVIYLDDENKFNIEIIFRLIRSDLLNVGEYDVHLAKLIEGGRNKVATEFAISLVQKLITQDSSISELCDVVDALSKDSSAVMSFPVTISVDNPGSVLPDSLNASDTLEKYKQVSQKGMIKCSTRLQRRQFRPSTVCWKTSKDLEMQLNKLFKEVIQSDFVELMQEHLKSILQSFRSSEDLILIEQKAVIGLEEQEKRMLYHHCKPTFIDEYDPKIESLEKRCKRNHKALNQFETGLFLYCKNNDPLALKVADLHERNKIASKDVAVNAKMFYDYSCRFDIETKWIPEMSKRLEGNREMFTFAASEVRDLGNKVLELIAIVDDLVVSVNESPNDFETQIAALRTLILVSESARYYSKVCSLVHEYVGCMCCVFKNARILLEQKKLHAGRFYRTEYIIAQEIPKMTSIVDNLHREVDIIRRSYDKKMSGLKDVQGLDTRSYTYKIVDGNSDFSMRNRDWGGRNVCPAIRTQGRGKCSYVATVSCAESRYKRMSADDITVGSQCYRQDEFIIKLSPDHLEDMVQQFVNNSHRKPSNLLDVALGRMEEEGVVSEEAYNNAKFDLQDYRRYRIKGFEALNVDKADVARAKLKDGKALIGNFKITTEYYRLGGNDIYEIPEDAVFETNPAGVVNSHCVVIVGFGMTQDGLPYYIFQNSYGPAWGSDGYGRVACSSLKRLYSPDVAPSRRLDDV